MHVPLPESESDLSTFVAAFEACTLPKQQWTHAAHLLTGACYVHALGEDAALNRVRERVSAYNLSVGGQNTSTSGYHETITAFWIKLLAHFHQRHTQLPRAAFAHAAVERFAADRAILARFYSYDVVASTEARAAWHPPDLQPISSTL